MSEIIKLRNPNVELERFYRASDRGGIPQSIDDVSDAGLSRGQGYEFAIAKGLNPQIDLLYKFMDLDIEVIEFSSDKSFKGIKKGEQHLAIISGASTFSHDTKKLKAFIEGKGTLGGRNNVGLTNYRFPFAQEQIDSLTGEGEVYVSDEKGAYHKQNIELWTPDQFLEISGAKDNKFLTTNLLYGKKVYGVVLSPEERKNIPNGRFDINSNDIITHIINAIAFGGMKPYKLLLDGTKEKGYSEFCGWNLKLPNNTGSVGIVDNGNDGFDGNHLDRSGASFGVAPEARRALVKAYMNKINQDDLVN